jgi:toxin ParE1/3/4
VQIIFTPPAASQIERLHEYITTHSGEQRADDYVNRIVAFCEGLKTFPLRGTRHDNLLPGLSVIGFERRATIAFAVIDSAHSRRRNFLCRTGF